MSTTTILLLLLAVLIAGALSFYQYLYKIKNKTKLHLFLTCLRFLSYFSIFLLLINPIISRKTIEDTKTPLPLFFDNSQSISELKANENVQKVLDVLKNNSKLKEKFEVQTYIFDDEINQNEILDFKGKQTKIDQIAADCKQLYKAPLYPIVIVTDGNQTQGNDYIYSFQTNTNVFPVIVGDTTEIEDLKINQVNVNKYAFLKNKFPVEVFVQYNGLKLINATVSISEGSAVVFKENITFSASQKVKTINALLQANKIGSQKYTVTVSSAITEKNKRNNTKYFAVDVIDQRKEIAIISAVNHPDLGAIKRSIESNAQRKVTIFKPKEIKDLSKYNLCIFYQPTAEFSSLVKQANSVGINAFYITGKSTDFSLMNQLQQEISFKIGNQKENYFANFYEQFNLFAQEDINFAYFPPLENGFGTITPNANVTTLLKARINQVEIENPLLCFSENGNARKGFLFGENLWKWRMESHVKTKSFEQFDLFMDKMIQFLTTTNAKKSLVVTHESFYNAGEPIEISAQFFNKNYEFDENAKLTIALTNTTTKTSKTYDFIKGNNDFKINLDNLEAGNYNFIVTEKNTNTKYSNSFEILDFEIEKQFVNADKNRLEQLANNTNGKAFYPSNLERLIENLLANENYKVLQKEIIKKTPLIDWKWILIFLALLLSTEWFVRKYNGYL